MPFKPKPPPQILFIQSLSTGRVMRPSVGSDDFTGEAIQPVEDNQPVRAVPSGNDLVIKRHKRKQEAAEAVLVRAGMGELIGHVEPKPTPKPIVPTLAGQRPVGKLGDRVLYQPLPPWRRW